jgi:acetolactate synthase-1/2/3 large subunit
MIVFTTDIPLNCEKRNMLTGLDQTSLYKGITKETLTVTKGSDVPFILRRAFRLATTGRPGPIHIRIPMDVTKENVQNPQIYAQKDFARYPGHRPAAEIGKMKQAVDLLSRAERPVIICGQGVLYSQAWEEVVEVAELFGIPVGTTMTGKGSIAETHPLSIGVVGSRGGTSFSNKVVSEADLIFYAGCNTDSASTANWTLPSEEGDTKIIHLDISEVEVGNNYRTEVVLIGDAKATLRRMIEIVSERMMPGEYKKLPRIVQILDEAKKYDQFLERVSQPDEKPIHPLRFTRELSKALPTESILVADAGVGAIYTSAFYKTKKAGRQTIFNYALGALGYAIPASIGVHYARPDNCVVALTGDGSFGFAAGEFETISRVGGNINIILFNNRSFGWIKAAIFCSYGPKYQDFATNFKEIDYGKIVEGFGLKYYRIGKFEDTEVLRRALVADDPSFIEVKAEIENELVPPVPSWVKKAKELGIRYTY